MGDQPAADGGGYGPGLLDVVGWQNRDAVVIHMVNLTNPMAMKGPYRDFFPVEAQKVSVRLPAAMHATSAHLLVAGRTAAMERSGGELLITVPSIRDHEVVAIHV